MKKRILSFALAAVFLISLVSCSKSNGFKGEAMYDMAYNESYDIMPTEEAEMYSDGYSSSGTGYNMKGSDYDKSKENNDLSARKIIKTADLSFQTKEYDKFLSAFKASVSKYGGYIESSDIYGGGDTVVRYSRNARMTVRVPADKYDSFVGDVSNLASLTRSNEYIDDVTLRYVDIESRINAYETEYNALMELLAKAESVDAIIQLRNRISDIQYQLDSAKSQIRKYDDLISYCTVNMYVEEVKIEKVSEDKLTVGERIRIGFAETIDEIKEGAEDFAVWFVVNLPHIIINLLVIAVIVVIIVLIVKKAKKKVAKKANKAVNKIENKTKEPENKENNE